MKNKLLVGLAIGVLMYSTIGIAEATMISPTNVINNSFGELGSGFGANNLINHSGLVTNFTSGTTQLSTYVAGDTGHSTPSSSGVGFASPSNNITSGIIDFDLGSSYNLTKFLLWNDNDYQGIKNFTLFVDDEASFSGATLLGTFSASYGPSGYNLGVPLQQFDLNDSTGRYVRLQIENVHDNYSNLVNFGEIAFDATSSAPVPEPSTMLLFGGGLVGLAFWRKRKQQK